MDTVLILGAVIVVVIALLIWAEVIERRDRHARREWHRAYQRRGGLIGSLMRNWRPTPRLTDQRDRRED